MRVKVRVPAAPTRRFAAHAADNMPGRTFDVNAEALNGRPPIRLGEAEVVEAEVVEGGAAILLELEAEDTPRLRKLAEFLHGGECDGCSIS